MGLQFLSVAPERGTYDVRVHRRSSDIEAATDVVLSYIDHILLFTRVYVNKLLFSHGVCICFVLVPILSTPTIFTSKIIF